ncbi:hypothetical protein HY227_00070 [Candidatus Wolfebacteria bacterium]|nr:hypothetical protein [Candidatus Wolfebacteria bacterium]
MGKVLDVLSAAVIPLMGFAAIYLLFIIFKEEGWGGVWTTLRVDTLRVLVKFLILIVVFFLITGAINHWCQRHPERISEIISGKDGKIKMIVLSMVLPGPAGGEQLQNEWNNGGNKTNVILCLIGMMALGFNVIVFRAKVLGTNLILIWIGIAIAIFIQVYLICKILKL